MSYDNWKTTEPYNPDNEKDDREWVHCDHCDKWILDGDDSNGRLGRDYVCGECFNRHPAIIGPIMAAIKAGEE